MWHKNIKAQNILVFVITLTGLGSSYILINQEPVLSSEEKQQIEQTVFSHLTGYLSSHYQNHDQPDYFFIGISGNDPSDETLTSLRNNLLNVEPFTSAHMSYGFSSSITHKLDKNKSGMIIDIQFMEKQKNG